MSAAVLLTILKKRRKQWWLHSGPSREDRRAVLTGSERSDEFIKQGKLGKRGARIGDAWNARWVCLSPEDLTYFYYEEPTHTKGGIIDTIPIEEVVDVVPEVEAAALETEAEHDAEHDNHGSANEEGETKDRRAKFRERSKASSSRRDILARTSDCAFMIRTREDGVKEGRKYRFQASSKNEMHDWFEAIQTVRDHFQPAVPTAFGRARLAVKAAYETTSFQILIAIAIFINFMCNAIEAELLPEDGSEADKVLQAFDLVFVVLFTVELAINMFGNLFVDFFMDGWNYFDTFVVIVSLVATFADENPGLNVLRMVRAFRVFRLFRRLKSLGQIMHAITQSLPAVANAFFLVLLMTSIYAIMGTSFFRLQYPQSFLSFSVSMYTMFQIMTFDDSAEVTLEIMGLQTTTVDTLLVAAFTISFQLIVGFILSNIVMAVLLDKFTEASEKSKAEEAEEAKAAAAKKASTVLDPMLEQLAKVETESMLMRRIEEAFRFIDEDGSGMVDFQEMRSGLKRMDTDPVINLTAEDYSEHVISRGLALHDGGMDLRCFKTFIGIQLKEYVHKQMAKAAGEVRPDEKLTAILRSLQQTAFVICSSQEMVTKLETRVVDTRSKIAKINAQVRGIGQPSANQRTFTRNQIATVREGLAGTPPAISTHAGNNGGGGSVSGGARDLEISQAIPAVEETLHEAKPREATVAHSMTPAPVVYSSRGTGSLEQHGALPLPLTAATPGLAQTPQSLLESTLTGKSRPTTLDCSLSTPVDVLDIRGLNARVDAMQMRLVYTIQQAKAAREKTRAVFARRSSDLDSSASANNSTNATPSSLLGSAALRPVTLPPLPPDSSDRDAPDAAAAGISPQQL